MLKFGIETETLHLWFQNKRIDVFGFIEKAAEFGYDGVVLNIIEKKNQMEGLGAIGRDDPGHLAKVRDLLRENNLYVELDTRGTSYEHLCHVLDIAEFLGAERIRTFIMGTASTYSHGNLGGSFSHENLLTGTEDLKKIVPELERRRIFLAVENHELETAEDLNWIVEQTNSPWVGLLYDPGNYMNAWQDPVKAAQIAAPNIIGTHMKDNIVCMDGDEHVITGARLGEGNIDLEKVTEILLKNTTLQRLNIEICYPYTSVFQRPAGTGGSSEYKGAFAIKDAPLPVEEVRPKDYYLYEGKMLEELLQVQMENMRNAIPFFKNICAKFGV